MNEELITISRDWFDYFRDGITIIGYLATVGAFLYLFRRDNDKQNQIDQLAKLALVNEEQLMLSVMPDLYKNGASTRPVEMTIAVDLLNRGENARLLEYKSDSPDIKLINSYLPYTLEKERECLIFMNCISKLPKDCEYKIEIIYEDKIRNQYSLFIEGKGANVKFGESKLIKYRDKNILI